MEPYLHSNVCFYGSRRNDLNFFILTGSVLGQFCFVPSRYASLLGECRLLTSVNRLAAVDSWPLFCSQALVVLMQLIGGQRSTALVATRMYVCA